MANVPLIKKWVGWIYHNVQNRSVVASRNAEMHLVFIFVEGHNYKQNDNFFCKVSTPPFRAAANVPDLSRRKSALQCMYVRMALKKARDIQPAPPNLTASLWIFMKFNVRGTWTTLCARCV